MAECAVNELLLFIVFIIGVWLGSIATIAMTEIGYRVTLKKESGDC